MEPQIATTIREMRSFTPKGEKETVSFAAYGFLLETGEKVWIYKRKIRLEPNQKVLVTTDLYGNFVVSYPPQDSF